MPRLGAGGPGPGARGRGLGAGADGCPIRPDDLSDPSDPYRILAVKTLCCSALRGPLMMFRRALAPVMVTVAAVVALAGCAGGDAPAATAKETGKPVVSAAPAAKTVAPAAKAPATGKSAPLVGKIKVDERFNASFEVDERFGPGTAKSAFEFAMKFHRAEAYRESRLRAATAKMSAKDFASVLSYMSPVAAKDWKAAAAKVRTSKDAQGDLGALVNFGYENEGWALRTDVVAMNPVSFNNSTVTVSKDRRKVVVRTYLNAQAHWVAPNGQHVVQDQERTTTLLLIRSGRGGWVIDGWNGTNKHDKAVVDPS